MSNVYQSNDALEIFKMLVEDDKITFRTVTIGDSSVGKTSIVNRFVRDRFNPNEQNTIGALYDSFQEVRDGQEIQVQIWDTAGQEQYRSLSPVYFRSAAAAIIVFDVTNRDSFANVKSWLDSFRAVSNEKSIVIICCNKIDLDGRAIEENEAKDFATHNDCAYVETSAKTGEGVNELFRSTLIDLLVRKYLEDPSAHLHVDVGERLVVGSHGENRSTCSC